MFWQRHTVHSALWFKDGAGGGRAKTKQHVFIFFVISIFIKFLLAKYEYRVNDTFWTLA